MSILNFSKDYVLEDDVVKLDPLKKEHIQQLSEISKEASIWTYLTEKGDGTDRLTAYIQATLNQRQAEKEYPFVVYDKLKGKYAGTTRFYDYSADLKTIKLGHTWYGEAFRGTGLNKRCKYLLFRFAFEKLALERVGFGAHIENKISISAMKSVGCKKEGVLRNFLPSLDGKGRTDVILMSLLKNEWETTVRAQLDNKIKRQINKPI